MTTKYLVALAFFPDSTPDTALRRLERWIKKNTGLCKALAEAGHTANQHHYTNHQQQLIYQYLGEP